MKDEPQTTQAKEAPVIESGDAKKVASKEVESKEVESKEVSNTDCVKLLNI